MAYWSENGKKLEVANFQIERLSQFEKINGSAPDVYFFRLPFLRNVEDANASESAFKKISDYCSKLNSQAVVCVLTTPADAAMLSSYLETHLKFQLWVAVKTSSESYPDSDNALPQNHTALLVFTKYKDNLRHTKTRVQYTYCPACGKTTKDYGGKKHIYHEYGTLLSDVWHDIEVNPNENIDVVINRIGDLFGLEPHQQIRLLDLQTCIELQPIQTRRSEVMPVETNAVRLNSRLINDDCLTTLKEIPNNSIDFCFADPPYNLKKKYDRWDDDLESVEYFAWCDQWLSELYRVLKPNRTLAVLNIPLWAARHFQHLNSFAKFQSWIAWDALGFPVRMIMPAHYSIICFSKGEPRCLPCYTDNRSEGFAALKEFYCLRASCLAKRNKLAVTDQTEATDLWYDIHRIKHNSRRVDHPCQLSPTLMRRLYEAFTKPDEMILDCFNGAGTSTLVAAQMNRRYIGIELSSQYHEIAVKRHEKLLQDIDPFGKINTVPTVKNSSVERLSKQKYKISKKELQLDVKSIAQNLDRLPTKDEVKLMSKFPFEYFEQYFLSWGEVCAAARTTGMSEEKPNSLENQLELFQIKTN
jgi:DNA modification methylase